MARTVAEWIGKTPDSKVPDRVRRGRDEETHPRRKRGKPVTLDWMFERTHPEPNSGCWIWVAAIDRRNGYGAVKVGPTVQRAHRVAYQLSHGIKVPSALDVCHRCDTRCCINPDHLFVGTRTDNMQDCIRKDRFSPIPVLTGESSPNSKLTEKDVQAIRSDSRSQRAIARSYGVDKGTIAHILHRKTWRHI